MKVRGILQPTNIIISIIFGLTVFLWTIGLGALNPSNIGWIKGIDSLTHYLGWSFFKDGNWHIPLGLNPDYGLGIGSSIVFSDSIPLVSIFLKLFSSLLPNTFQFFGMWLLLCFFLQSIIAFNLTKTLSKNQIIQMLCVVFFVVSPPMIWRILGVNLIAGIGPHTALASHFLILFSFYLTLVYEGKSKTVLWISLLCISLLIHFYIFFMVFFIFIGDCLDDSVTNKKISYKNILQRVAIGSLCLLATAWQAGYFSSHTQEISAVGYGLYRMPLFAIIDSAGWSRVLPPLKAAPGTYHPLGFSMSVGRYEGYNFLGLGGVCLLLISCILGILHLNDLKKYLKRHIFFISALIVLFLLAISNNVEIFSINISISIPNAILVYLDTIRSSGRLFWPVFYFITFSYLKIVTKYLTTKIVITLLAICAVAQIWDLAPGIKSGKQKIITDSYFHYESPFKNFFWASIPEIYKNILYYPLIHSQWQPNWEAISRFSSENAMGTNSVYLARTDPVKIDQSNRRLRHQLQSGLYEADSIYILGPWKHQPDLSIKLNERNDVLAKVDGFTVLAPGYKKTKNYLNFDSGLEITRYAPETLTGKPILFSKFTNNADLFLLESWGFPEEWGTWTTGRSAKIIIPIPDSGSSQITLIFKAFVSQMHPYQELDLDYIKRKRLRFTKPEGNQVILAISDQSRQLGYVSVELTLINSISPMELQLSNDSRMLGVGLVSATFH